MASEHDILSRLPEGPEPAPAARDAAMTEALLRFDQSNHARSQGFLHDLRLKQQTASSTPPSRRSSAMPRARRLIAASLAVLVTGSAVGLYVQRALYVHKPPPEIQIANAPTKIIPRTDNRFEQHSATPPGLTGYVPAAPADAYTPRSAYAPGSQDRIAEAPISRADPQLRDRLAQNVVPTVRIAPPEPGAPKLMV